MDALLIVAVIAFLVLFILILFTLFRIQKTIDTIVGGLADCYCVLTKLSQDKPSDEQQ